ncbi:MobC family plasmid mobilization relaxosome protein [Listeria rocourtiae]|uniref:MobC family plasmid mobilization relaxosome protein n=1 Tax=Listeria rocourtiae TaxID=647910 RepID=UPI0021AB35B4|nr:MobC family plasmid mobilization relaxosome protein [Listeria rocourtiae]
MKSNREASTGYGTPYPNFTPFRIRDSCLKLLVGEIPKPLVFFNNIGKEENKRMVNRNRNIDLKFRVTEEEKTFIEMKMKEAGITNREAYLRKMAIDGAIIVSNYDETKKLTLELNKIGTNINQIVRVANTDNRISKADIKNIEEMMQKVWQLQRYGLSKKRSIKQ